MMPFRLINAVAPVRVCDNGGWTDTWFARRGKVFSIAVSPHVEVQVKASPSAGARDRITIHAENYGDRYAIAEPHGCYGRYPLIEAAIERTGIARDLAVEISIYSEAPPGCSTGTSAAVSVALVGALDFLGGRSLTAHEAAMAAFDIETRLLGQQCGIQDQLASAHGGINFIDIQEYPHASVAPLTIPEPLRWELEARLALIYVGAGHSSTAVHGMVIRRLEADGMDSPHMEELRFCAEMARDALIAGDLEALGRAMTRNTAAQAELHPGLVGPHHRNVIEIAREFGASGWKVNGAGGEGGSVTLLCHADRPRRRELLRQIAAADPRYRHIPVALAPHGLRVWESPAGSTSAAVP